MIQELKGSKNDLSIAFLFFSLCLAALLTCSSSTAPAYKGPCQVGTKLGRFLCSPCCRDRDLTAKTAPSAPGRTCLSGRKFSCRVRRSEPARLQHKQCMRRGQNRCMSCHWLCTLCDILSLSNKAALMHWGPGGDAAVSHHAPAAPQQALRCNRLRQSGLNQVLAGINNENSLSHLCFFVVVAFLRAMHYISTTFNCKQIIFSMTEHVAQEVIGSSWNLAWKWTTQKRTKMSAQFLMCLFAGGAVRYNKLLPRAASLSDKRGSTGKHLQSWQNHVSSWHNE